MNDLRFWNIGTHIPFATISSAELAGLYTPQGPYFKTHVSRRRAYLSRFIYYNTWEFCCKADFQISVKRAKQFPLFLCNMTYVTTVFSDMLSQKSGYRQKF